MLNKVIKLFTILVFFSITSQAAGNIRKIEVRDSQRVELSTILSYIPFKEGDSYNAEKVNSALKDMYETELFSNINIYMEGSVLVVKVQENPIINKIGFEGNKRVNDDTITSQILLKPRSVYTKSKVQSDVLVIQDIYRKSGRYSAKIEPKVVLLDQNRVNLVFEIDEGKKASVKKIYFVGNNRFNSNDLKKVLNTKESHWYTFYSSNDSYDPDKVAYDKELLRKFYTAKGYADFNVTSVTSEITEDKESFILNFYLDEGNKYKFGDINVRTALPDISKATFKKEIKTEKGEVYNANYIDDTVDNITNHLNNIGYAFVEVVPEYDRDINNKIMGLTYNIKEGPKVYIDKINISGNVRTLDKVIRREFRLAEGDPFNAAKIKRSRQRIENLGFFDKVDLKTEPGDDPDKANINVEIGEKSTGELNFGTGYSTTEGLIGNVSIRERNLLGRAQDIKLGYQKSSRGDNIDLNFTEPYFMDKDLSTSVGVYTSTRDNKDESSFDSKTSGGSVSAAYSLTENLRHTLKYAISTVEITGVQADASVFVREQTGRNITSLVGHSLTYDKRDNKYEPTDGYFVTVSEDFAGVGGDSQFVRHEARYGFFKPVVREDVVFNVSLKGGHVAGWGDKNVRINERFFVGGSNLRGFKDAGIGPRDSVTRDSLGGNIYYSGTTGFSFPLGLPEELGFKGEVFLDAGSLFDVDASGPTVVDKSSLRASAGFGVSWTSPLGPIRVDFANAFRKEEIDRTQLLRLDFGTRF